MRIDDIIQDRQIKDLFETACTALQENKEVELIGDGKMSQMHIHAVGLSNEGRAVVYGLEYRSGQDFSYAWKFVHLDELVMLAYTGETFETANSVYVKPDASRMTVYEEVH